MTNDINILKQFGEVLLTDVKSVIPIVTGKTAEQTELKSNEVRIQILVAPYIKSLIDGRKPTREGAKSSGESLYSKILEWVKAKGIQPREQSMSQKSLAYVITRSIHLNGTKLFQEGGGNRIFDTVLTTARINSLASLIAESKQKDIGTLIDNELLRLT